MPDPGNDKGVISQPRNGGARAGTGHRRHVAHSRFRAGVLFDARGRPWSGEGEEAQIEIRARILFRRRAGGRAREHGREVLLLVHLHPLPSLALPLVTHV